MFCTSKKTMLCIKCFRDTSAEDRLHCVDLDTAYNQGAKKLERSLAVSSLTLGVDFINVLRTAFMLVVPKSVKRLTTSLSLLGSTSEKAVPRTLVKLTLELLPFYQNPNNVSKPIQIIRDTFKALF